MPGQLKAKLDGAVAFRVGASVNSCLLLDGYGASPVAPPSGRAVSANEAVEEFQTVDCSVEESRELLPDRWGSGRTSPTAGPVTQWWENTCADLGPISNENYPRAGGLSAPPTWRYSVGAPSGQPRRTSTGMVRSEGLLGPCPIWPALAAKVVSEVMHRSSCAQVAIPAPRSPLSPPPIELLGPRPGG